MYDNINNNQNFNNGVKPLFENDFNNNLNTTNSPSQQNGGYPTYAPNMQQSVPQNIFNNSFNIPAYGQNIENVPNYSQQFNVQQDSTNVYSKPFETSIQSDIPPELGEIKNLSDATVSSAPTMDVLNPMNIMPENPEPKDPLSAYENGDTAGFNSINQPIFQNQSQIMPQSNNVSINGFENNLGQSTPTLNQPYQGPSSVNLPNQSQFSNFGQLNSVNSSQQNTSFMQSPVVNNQNMTFNSTLNTDGANNLFSNASQLDNTVNNYDQHLASTQEIGVPSSRDDTFKAMEHPTETPILSQQPQTTNNELNRALEDNETNLSVSETKESNPDDLKQINNSDDVSLVETQENDQASEEKNSQNESSSNGDNTETKLSDLGLDDSYNEPDTLDIMDLNEEETPSMKTNNDEPLTNQVVDKIKSLIEDLKSLGAKIDFEEFDFEKMYQLIIKIEK